LPADVPSFTGRAIPLAELDALLAGGAGGGSGEPAPVDRAPAVVISAIAGAAGVGKTALAVHWGHRVRSRFPDGQLYVDLRGYALGPPMRPIDALGRFLRALGVPAEQVPVDEDEAAARYRSFLADRRVLVVLDNAAGPEQVRPLLPGGSGSLVVITSRDRLAGLVAREGAARLVLDVLAPTEAVALLARVLGERRVSAEPGAAAELTRLCGYLPLALRIAAANLTIHPDLRLADYVTELLEDDPLAALEVEGDERSTVRRAFDLSYTRLTGTTRRLFRLLGLVPGVDLDADAAAALTGVPVEEASRLLDRLTGAHLVDRPAAGRYALHDLLRRYAVARAEDEDTEPARRAALTRLFDHYQTRAAAAMDSAFPEKRHGRPSPQAAATAGRPLTLEAARAWLDAERANLVAVVGHASRHGWPEHACTLAATIWLYLLSAPHYTDAIASNEHALQAAVASGDRVAQGGALTNLGSVFWRIGRPVEAMTYLDRGLAIRREVGDRAGEGWTLNNMASVHWSCGRYPEFFDYCGQALAIFREVEDLVGEYTALNNISVVHLRRGHSDEALEPAERALAVARGMGYGFGEANALNTLSLIYLRSRRYPETLQHAGRALEIARKVGDRYSEACALDTFALVHLRQGHHGPALDHAERSLELARAMGHRHLEAAALNSLGEVHRAAGRPEAGLVRHQAAQRLAKETDNRDEEARALDGAAHALEHTGHPEQARQYWHQALRIYSALDVPEADEIRARLAGHAPASGDAPSPTR
jgi:tetratricopeptide (TPR) repeat protein